MLFKCAGKLVSAQTIKVAFQLCQLSELLFADDGVVTCSTREDMEEAFSALAR